MALVIALELINTAIEKLLNKLHPEFDETIGLAKDISASAAVSYTHLDVYKRQKLLLSRPNAVNVVDQT